MDTGKTIIKMSRLFKLFFSKQRNKSVQDLSADFDDQVRKAILLIENNDTIDINTDEAFLNYLIENGIQKSDAIEILLFLPIAFIRRVLPDFKWPDTYIEFVRKNKQVEKRYNETLSYQSIWQITTKYFENPNKDTVFKIAGRSAEFNVLNNVLNNHPDTKLEDVVISKTVLLR